MLVMVMCVGVVGGGLCWLVVLVVVVVVVVVVGDVGMPHYILTVT